MRETELKFQVPAAQRASVDKAVAGRGPQRRVRLQAAYVDTADRALARAGLALRVRREGRTWVQTLKGPSADGMSRLEHNVALVGAARVPAADPALHAGTPAGVALAAALAGAPPEALQVMYRTDILRRTRVLRTPAGLVELAFDTGHITAGSARLGVCELEFELKAGSPLAVVDVAGRWMLRHGLLLDSRSKAERGDLLARGELQAVARAAPPVALPSDTTAQAAWQAVLRSCAEQIIANASQVASADFSAEHVHQLRIGLRRLRTALQLFEPVPDAAALDEVATGFFRRLGAARDQAVLASEIAAQVDAAAQALGLDAEEQPVGVDTLDTDPAAVVREPATQRLLLDLLARAQDGPASPSAVDKPDAGGLRDLLAARLRRWHRRAAADAVHYAELDDAARHRLRKRVKRLRYAIEFCESLFAPRAVRRYVRPLRTLQERLGAINDVVVALQSFRELCASGVASPRQWFALGWLQGRRELLISEARPALKAFAKAKPFSKAAKAGS